MQYKIIFLLTCIIFVHACSPASVFTSAGVAGGTAAMSENGLRQSAIDTRIKLDINELWFEYDLSAFGKLSTTGENGRVLVTGVVQNPDHRVEAIRLAWQPSGVAQVINEVRVAGSEGISGFTKDSIVAGNLRAKIIFDKSVKSINYSIEVVQGTVYLIGVAQNRAELDIVIEHARNTPYVKQVVSYMKIKDETNDVMVDPALDNFENNL
jgi:osmotically-inducible protein OsmY